MPSNKFLNKLWDVCPQVIVDIDRLKVYESDALTAKKIMPYYVAIPNSITQVQAIAKLCHLDGVPLVVHVLVQGCLEVPHPMLKAYS